MIKPMRGVKPKKMLLAFPYLSSPKIDGLRAYVEDGVVLSKTGKLIPNRNVQRLFGELHGFDGELTVGPMNAQFDGDDVYDRSRGPIMAKNREADFRFWVFDRWDIPEEPAVKRVNAVAKELSAYTYPGVSVVEHKLLTTQVEVDRALQSYLADRFEGGMLRQADAPYKYGQSTENEGYLLKLKPMNVSTAIILEVYEQEENTNAATKDEFGYTRRSSAKAGKVGKGTFGSFLARDVKTGAEFRVGTGEGITDKVRQEWWAIKDDLPGRYFSYVFQEIGSKNAPRLPGFLRFRDAIDISETAEETS